MDTKAPSGVLRRGVVVNKGFFAIRDKFPATDFEQTSQFLTKLGIGHECRIAKDDEGEDYGIILIEEDMARVTGYSGFCIEFEFDGNGEFKIMVIGE